MVFFSLTTYLYRIFLARNRNQRLRIDPCAIFQLTCTKDKGTRILTWNDTKSCLMMSYLPPSDDISKIFMDFERLCRRVPSCPVSIGCNWTTNKGGGEEGTPAYMVLEVLSMNRVEKVTYLIFCFFSNKTVQVTKYCPYLLKLLLSF